MSTPSSYRTNTAVLEPPLTAPQAHGVPPHATTSEAFREVFRSHPAGVALITADAGDGPIAMTATSVASVSVHPPVLMFSASGHSSSTPTLRKAETVIVHFLGAENLHLAKLGATSGIDRFADTSLWKRLPSGEPVFTSATAWIRARMIQKIDIAGSTVVLCEAVDHGLGNRPAPRVRDGLAYVNRTWHRLSETSAELTYKETS